VTDYDILQAIGNQLRQHLQLESTIFRARSVRPSAREADYEYEPDPASKVWVLRGLYTPEDSPVEIVLDGDHACVIQFHETAKVPLNDPRSIGMVVAHVSRCLRPPRNFGFGV